MNKTRNVISSPACSLDRIELKADNKSLIISPKDKTYFVEVLQEKNPSIKVNV
ncbi:MAG: PH domain-containing protein [Vallitalea sp.]|nr:PH domain-containing protein [Vallitalea sp.]